jgi:hypothetical protein
MDKRMTNASYVIEIDPETQLPLSIRMTVLAGRRGATIWRKNKIVGGEHVVFNFDYKLSDFNEVEPLEIPAGARRMLASR